MAIVRARPIVAFAALCAAAFLLAACKKSGDQSTSQVANAVDNAAQTADASEKAHDPCTLLSASEAEPYVGTLASPPYRSADSRASVTGEECTYRGKDGRQIVVAPFWENGGAGKIIAGVPDLVDSALTKGGAAGMGGAAHRVMAKTEGPWDNATWIPGGSLMASKGEQSVNVDVSAASGQQKDAVAIATLMMPRFEHPLDYDGTKAVAMAPKPKAHPASPCDVIPKSAAAAAIGPMSSDPTAADDGSSCTYHVGAGPTARNYLVEYTWEGGQKNYNMLKHGMSTLGSAMGGNIPSMDNIKMDSNTKKMMGGLMKMVGGNTGAAGAVTQVGLQTDTTLKGPWDNASLLHGTQLIAVKNDVFVGMDLQSADYEKAKALMAAICSTL